MYLLPCEVLAQIVAFIVGNQFDNGLEMPSRRQAVQHGLAGVLLVDFHVLDDMVVGPKEDES